MGQSSFDNGLTLTSLGQLPQLQVSPALLNCLCSPVLPPEIGSECDVITYRR
jgi:hypothetical protein